MSAAMQLVRAFGTETMDLNQINAYTREENNAAITVLTRNGFSLAEKTLKEYVTFSYRK